MVRDRVPPATRKLRTRFAVSFSFQVKRRLCERFVSHSLTFWSWAKPSPESIRIARATAKSRFFIMLVPILPSR